MKESILDQIEQFSDDRYGNENRLNARFQIYDYCENKTSLQEWIFEKMDFTGVRDVLDLGCGNGLLWKSNLHRIPENTNIMLSDISEGMVDAARENLYPDDRFSFHVTDACETPFDGNKYRMIVANHMINHIVDKPIFFSELCRLLTDNGYAYASTLSSGNFLEAFSIADGFDQRLIFKNDDIPQGFTLENGEKILSNYFDVTDQYTYENDVIITCPEPLLLYLASCFQSEQLDIMINRFDDFRKHIELVIARSEQLRITNRVVLFKFRKIR